MPDLGGKGLIFHRYSISDSDNIHGRWLTLTSGGTRAMESAPLLITSQARDATGDVT